MLQNFQMQSEKIRKEYLRLKAENPERLDPPLKFGWDAWSFGNEAFIKTVQRLHRFGVTNIQALVTPAGNDVTPQAAEWNQILKNYGMTATGLDADYTAEVNIASPSPFIRQAGIDYIRRLLDFGATLGVEYILVVPGCVGQSVPFDAYEMERSAASLLRLAGDFASYGIRCAIEPIRSGLVSTVHTVKDAIQLLEMVNHPAIYHINADVYHIMLEEGEISTSLIQAGERMANLHISDSNRGTLGSGCMDLDTIIMTLYVMGYNQMAGHVTAELLDKRIPKVECAWTMPEILDDMVERSARYFREREQYVRSLAPDEAL